MTQHRRRLEGKVAVVTGAGSSGPGVGTGKATSIVFAREGAKVLLVDRDPDAARETLEVIEGAGGVASIFEADVAKIGDCEALVDAAAEFKGPARMDEFVELETWIDEWRGRTFVVKHVVSRDGETLVEGQEIRVWAVRDSSAPKGIRAGKIPAEIKARFEAGP